MLSDTDMQILKRAYVELSDEELYEIFGDIYEVIKEKVKTARIRMDRKQLNTYSNKSYHNNTNESDSTV